MAAHAVHHTPVRVYHISIQVPNVKYPFVLQAVEMEEHVCHQTYVLARRRTLALDVKHHCVPITHPVFLVPVPIQLTASVRMGLPEQMVFKDAKH